MRIKLPRSASSKMRRLLQHSKHAIRRSPHHSRTACRRICWFYASVGRFGHYVLRDLGYYCWYGEWPVWPIGDKGPK